MSFFNIGHIGSMQISCNNGRFGQIMIESAQQFIAIAFIMQMFQTNVVEYCFSWTPDFAMFVCILWTAFVCQLSDDALKIGKITFIILDIVFFLNIIIFIIPNNINTYENPLSIVSNAKTENKIHLHVKIAVHIGNIVVAIIIIFVGIRIEWVFIVLEIHVVCCQFVIACQMFIDSKKKNNQKRKK